MNKPTLIAITHELAVIGNAVIAQDGEISEDQSLELTYLLQQSEDKVTSYVNYMEDLEKEKMLVSMAIKEAQKYIERLDRTQESLKRSALRAIEIKGKKLVGNFGHWISTRLTKSVSITDPTSLPKEYLRTVTTHVPDKVKIKEAIESGHTVVGAELSEKISVTWR